MVRLADLPEWDRKSKLAKAKELTGFDTRPWVEPPPLARSRIAIVTTAGLHRKGDRPFGQNATDYRIIPGATPASDLVMSHQSVNFDRTGFQEDHNIVFPIDRLAGPDKTLQQLCATSLVPRTILVTLPTA